MTLFGSNREDLRRAYLDAWGKHGSGAPLTPLEALIADVIGAHPEYQALLQDPAAALAYEPSASGGEENLFFHLGLHLAIREQLSIDRPPGVCDVEQQLAARLGNAHDAEHALMEALAETLWEAQRSGRPPDETRYLMLARRRLFQN
jgi:hypothetical protein